LCLRVCHTVSIVSKPFSERRRLVGVIAGDLWIKVEELCDEVEVEVVLLWAEEEVVPSAPGGRGRRNVWTWPEDRPTLKMGLVGWMARVKMSAWRGSVQMLSNMFELCLLFVLPFTPCFRYSSICVTLLSHH